MKRHFSVKVFLFSDIGFLGVADKRASLDRIYIGT